MKETGRGRGRNADDLAQAVDVRNDHLAAAKRAHLVLLEVVNGPGHGLGAHAHHGGDLAAAQRKLEDEVAAVRGRRAALLQEKDQSCEANAHGKVRVAKQRCVLWSCVTRQRPQKQSGEFRVFRNELVDDMSRDEADVADGEGPGRGGMRLLGEEAPVADDVAGHGEEEDRFVAEGVVLPQQDLSLSDAVQPLWIVVLVEYGVATLIDP